MVHRFVLLLVESNQNKEVNQERLIFVTIYLVVVLKILVLDKERPLCKLTCNPRYWPTCGKAESWNGLRRRGPKKTKRRTDLLEGVACPVLPAKVLMF